MVNSMKVLITIPAYNEERTLPLVLEEIKEVMKQTSHQYEILVVDDGSRDRTAEISQRHGAVVVSKKHQGLAETFKKEIQECLKRKADIIVHTDADGQYPPQHIPELIKKIQEGYDL
ncbi:glycosyltransferase family 2 protein, partial [Candidatus Woesearchaeota archaeon]|nr:glycosyltransferase family 2 protein [Candidatus Woesearchaeota archaeon]